MSGDNVWRRGNHPWSRTGTGQRVGTGQRLVFRPLGCTGRARGGTEGRGGTGGGGGRGPPGPPGGGEGESPFPALPGDDVDMKDADPIQLANDLAETRNHSDVSPPDVPPPGPITKLQRIARLPSNEHQLWWEFIGRWIDCRYRFLANHIKLLEQHGSDTKLKEVRLEWEEGTPWRAFCPVREEGHSFIDHYGNLNTLVHGGDLETDTYALSYPKQ